MYSMELADAVPIEWNLDISNPGHCGYFLTELSKR